MHVLFDFNLNINGIKNSLCVNTCFCSCDILYILYNITQKKIKFMIFEAVLLENSFFLNINNSILIFDNFN